MIECFGFLRLRLGDVLGCLDSNARPFPTHSFAQRATCRLAGAVREHQTTAGALGVADGLMRGAYFSPFHKTFLWSEYRSETKGQELVSRLKERIEKSVNI